MVLLCDGIPPAVVFRDRTGMGWISISFNQLQLAQFANNLPVDRLGQIRTSHRPLKEAKIILRVVQSRRHDDLRSLDCDDPFASSGRGFAGAPHARPSPAFMMSRQMRSYGSPESMAVRTASTACWPFRAVWTDRRVSGFLQKQTARKVISTMSVFMPVSPFI